MQHEARIERKFLAQQGGQIPVDLDRIERTVRLEEELRERAASRTDLHQCPLACGATAATMRRITAGSCRKCCPKRLRGRMGVPSVDRAPRGELMRKLARRR